MYGWIGQLQLCSTRQIHPFATAAYKLHSAGARFGLVSLPSAGMIVESTSVAGGGGK